MGEQLLVTIGAKDSASTVIKKVNSELKYLDREYGLAKKSSKEFENSQDGLKTKLDYLGNKYEVNKTKLQAYKNQLDKAKESVAKKEAELEKLKNAEGDNAVAIEKAEKQLEKYKDQLDKANKNINLTEKEMSNLTQEIDSTSESLDNFKVEQFKAKMKDVSKNVEKTGQNIKKVGEGVSNIGSGLMKAAAPFVAFGGLAVKAEIDFETAFTGVKKTVDGTTEQFEALEKGIKDMSMRMPQSAVQIAAVAEAAGQLGIKTDAILGFTETMVMLGDSTNMSSDEAATALARLANITQMPQDKFKNLGSTIVALGNNLATTESEITEMGLRLAGAGKQIGLSEPKILGLAGALSSVGIEAEAGGSAFSKVMVQMQLAAEIGTKANEVIATTGMSLRDLQMMASLDGKGFKEVAANVGLTTEELKKLMGASSDLESFSKVTGKTAAEFKKSFKENASGAIIEFITGLQTCEEEGVSAIAVLDNMGITEVRLRDSLLRAAGAGDVFSNSIKIGTEAWDENNALTNEASKRYETTASKITMLKNRFMDLGIELGEELLPYVSDLMDGLEKLINWFGGLDSETQKTILTTGLMTFATGGLLKVVGGATQGIGSLVGVTGKAIGKFGEFAAKAKTMETVSSMASVGGVGKLGAAITGVGTATTGATGGVSILSTGLSALGGIALPLAATVAALGGAFYVAHEYNDLMSSSMLKSIDEMSAMEIILGRLTGATLHSKEEMEKMGYVYAEWNSDVSPETQKALDGIAEKSRNLQLAIDSVNFDGVITKEDINIVKTKTDEWCNSIIEVINNNKSEINSSIEGLFGADGIVTEQEQKVLDILNNSNDEKKKIVEESAAKIKEINERASKENREISRAEQAVIKGEIIKANKAVLDSMNISSEEKLAAQNLFFEKSNAHSARALSESILQEKTARDEQIAVIKEKYDAGIQALKAKIPELKGLEKEQAEAELQNQIEQRDMLIQNENEKWNGIIGACEERYPQYMDKINKYTGEEMSFWDRRKNERFQKEIAKYDEINRITEDGTYKLLNTETKTWDNIVVKTDEATGEIIALNKLNVSERGIGRDSVVGYSKDICNQMDEEVRNAIKNRSIMTSIMNGYTKATVDSNGNILDSNNKVIGSLDRMTTATDGTRQGFIDINGTPVKIKTNADGTIKNLKDIKSAIDNIPLNKNVTLTIKEQRWRSSASDGIDRFYADGTNYAQPGVAFVAEEGQELIEKNGTFYLTGDDGPQLFNFSGGEKVYTAAQTRDILTSGSYYNADSLASRELINSTTNNYNTYDNSSTNTGGIDYSVMAQTVAQAVAQAIQNISLTGSVKLDDNSIIGKVSNSFAMAGRRAR